MSTDANVMSTENVVAYGKLAKSKLRNAYKDASPITTYEIDGDMKVVNWRQFWDNESVEVPDGVQVFYVKTAGRIFTYAVIMWREKGAFLYGRSVFVHKNAREKFTTEVRSRMRQTALARLFYNSHRHFAKFVDLKKIHDRAHNLTPSKDFHKSRFGEFAVGAFEKAMRESIHKIVWWHQPGGSSEFVGV